jgi:hypothetical protein
VRRPRRKRRRQGIKRDRQGIKRDRQGKETRERRTKRHRKKVLYQEGTVRGFGRETRVTSKLL